jgi:WD40 repeat protein
VRSPNGAGFLSFDASLNGYTLATGTVLLKGEDASIHFWDARKPTVPIFSHTSTHSDDITSLHFHPTIPDRLLSASSDGLLSITNAAEQDEDEAVEHVGNWGCSVAQTGWYHDGVWAASDMETFSLWTSELDKVFEPNFKEIAPRARYSWGPDYLIGCHRTQDRLTPIVGANTYANLIHRRRSVIQSQNLDRGSFSFLSPPSSQPWTVDRTYSSHHDGIVRSLLVDDVLGCLVSGGEDGALHLWDLTPPDTPTSPSKPARKRGPDGAREADEMDVDHAPASVLDAHHYRRSLMSLVSRPKSRNGGDPRPHSALDISP